MLELLINLQLRQLCVVEANVPTDHMIACYPVAVGKQNTPTPTGNFKITRVVQNPSFVSCRTGVDHGKGFLGDLALVTNRETSSGCSFAIHGTNREDLIGLEVSEGCLRLRNRDINHIEQNFLPYIEGGQVQ